MKANHLKRALLAAILGGLAVAVFVFVTTIRTPRPGWPSTEEDVLFLAGLWGGIAALAAAVVTFLVSRFAACRRAALVATSVSLLVSVLGGSGQSTWEAALHPGVHSIIWIIYWPITFGGWSLAELQVSFARMFWSAQARAVAARASQGSGPEAQP